jgi:hypothetical protein
VRWVKEGYSQRQLALQSHLSQTKIKRIKTHWLSKRPFLEQLDFKEKYLVFDGTYFSHRYCLLSFWNPQQHQIIISHFNVKESYLICVSWFAVLKQRGFSPKAITMDGNTQVIRAIKEVWPTCIIQRCLYHIQRQGQMWLRRNPKLDLTNELKSILSLLPLVKNHSQRDRWWHTYLAWKLQYRDQIKHLDSHHRVESDIIRTYRMIENAAKDMFHYLEDSNVPSTSNGIESYFSWLKDHYKKHRGLRKAHLENYLLWYVYLTKTRN